MNRKKRIGNPTHAFLFCLFALFNGFGYAQNVAINADGSLPNKNAILDVKSDSKGMLIPRITTEARLKIPNTQGLLVYDVNTNSFWYNTGKLWQNLAPAEASAKIADSAWSLTGNAGTVDGVNFLGTIDNVPLTIKVNNQMAGRIDHQKNNTVLGFQSAFNMTTGTHNTVLGALALSHNTTGLDNTAVGANTLQYNNGFSNSAFGRMALHNNTTGVANTASGASAMQATRRGSHNTANGAGALYSNNGDYNTAIGAYANWCCGTGNENTAVGNFSLMTTTSGDRNTAVGGRALQSNGNGNYNVGVGYQAVVRQHSSRSTAIGGESFADGENSTALGFGAVSNASNKVRIGNAAVTVIEGQVPFTFPSDGRFKFGVQQDVKGLDFILQLRPVTYHFDTKRFDSQLTGDGNAPAADAAYDKATQVRRTGFIAQEVEEAAKKSGYDFSGVIAPNKEQKHYSLSYDAFVVPLVKAMQEQQQLIDQQNKKIEEMQRELEEIKKLLQRSK